MYSFKDMPLLQMEREAVGAVIDHEHAVRIAASRLRVDDFRSHEADHLRQVFYVVLGWYEQGKWDDLTNRDRLEAYGLENDYLWCPWAVIPEYVEALCDAITQANALDDAAVEAVRLRDEHYPISRSSRPATPRLARKYIPPPKERRYYGGIQT